MGTWRTSEPPAAVCKHSVWNRSGVQPQMQHGWKLDAKQEHMDESQRECIQSGTCHRPSGHVLPILFEVFKSSFGAVFHKVWHLNRDFDP